MIRQAKIFSLFVLSIPLIVISAFTGYAYLAGVNKATKRIMIGVVDVEVLGD